MFRCGESFDERQAQLLLPSEVISALEDLGILQRDGNFLSTGEFRLVSHLGLLLFFHRVSTRAKFYYGNDSLALSRLLQPTQGSVLDLCAGPGAQSLIGAKTAHSVTAVDLEESVQRVFWINAALNGLCKKVEFFSGDLFEPVRGRSFDRISANPPFLPVPDKFRFPLYAGGGEDGLDIVRRILQHLPDFLAQDGVCQIVASALGTAAGPELSSLDDVARSAQLDVEVSCYSFSELHERAIAAFAATVMDDEDPQHTRQAFRSHFQRLGATHIYYFVLRAKLGMGHA
jgi:methylase of polypeptide subunit release factors